MRDSGPEDKEVLGLADWGTWCSILICSVGDPSIFGTIWVVSCSGTAVSAVSTSDKAGFSKEYSNENCILKKFHLTLYRIHNFSINPKLQAAANMQQNLLSHIL